MYINMCGYLCMCLNKWRHHVNAVWGMSLSLWWKIFQQFWNLKLKLDASVLYVCELSDLFRMTTLSLLTPPPSLFDTFTRPSCERVGGLEFSIPMTVRIYLWNKYQSRPTLPKVFKAYVSLVSLWFFFVMFTGRL